MSKPHEPVQLCIYCGGDRTHPDHAQWCDGRQGRIEAAEPDPEPSATYDPIGHTRHTDPDTAHAAADSITRTAARQCNAIHRLIREHGVGGMTCAAVVVATGWLVQSVSRRITDLREQGFVVDSGRRRLGTAGRDQIVWIAVEFYTPPPTEH